ncbi:MAG: asparagine synthase (glutamine-hydrolyzing) [Ignavibacteria bacterium GWF2_33_9]|nr:MAG: asparagine synthase (glutamine-hydrolyzing) [Ignavibacteria bacterium GWF2_33_9]
MCGIAGIVKTKSNNYQIEKSLLKQMSDVIVHRGPDSDGQWLSKSGNAGFSFRRLAIIDLTENGNQPMQISDGRYTIVFNGEIYNHAELRSKLERKGYKYKSHTDTETILYGYQEWGEALLQKMWGMWSIAIWDEQRQEFFAARDRIGIKPFYYLQHNGNLIFGSEIKSIIQYKNYSPAVNYEQLPIYFTLGASSQENTLFESIKKLPAAHFLKYKLDGKVTIKQYWNPFSSVIPYENWTEAQLQGELMNLLRDAIKIRMMSDVPFGVFLSGGIDSSLNVALMHEYMDRRIDTFTVGYKDLLKYNELEYATQISKQFNTNHREIIIDNEMALPALEKLAWHLDEPNGDPVCIPIYFLSKLTRNEGTIVVLVGEGSDEQFIGYSWMIREIMFNKHYWKAFKLLPTMFRKAIYYSLKPILERANQYQMLDYFQKAANNWEQYWSGQPILTNVEQSHLFSPKYHQHLASTAHYTSKINSDAHSFDIDIDFSKQAIYTEFAQRLPEMLLMRVDKMGMANSIEPRVPFLDHRIVEMSFALDFKKKIPDGKTSKYLLKKASEGIIPDNIIYRRKQGFAAPVTEWLRNEWFDYTKNKLLNSQHVKEGIFSKDYINNILNLHKTHKKNFNKEIYSLLSFALWEEKFL